MSDLVLVNDRLNALIGNLSPQSRKEMALNIAKKLRASQQQNIKKQQSPDGTPYKPRKEQPICGKKGRVKREMFAKLRTAKYLKARATTNEAVVEFAGKVQRMVRVHQYGLRDRPSRSSKDIRYEPRPLLGINEEIVDIIYQVIINKLTD
ncbi:phage virion morphogenesis protein [Pantoea sp. Acro-807]|uniref:phage virion morphogenesis protein n=1 Tax=Pantoea sp. Acro-807 TaxID=2608356 RepID=UPI0014191BBF|nr:phage virion morphogenesis protein [Pantoea sp. Acro-807]NIE70332.1 phage virion morphogenesis protein [Pantoea sp. Acro-807]